MRLTEKDEQYVGGYCCIGNPDIEWKEKAYSKLGQLEDIEDNLPAFNGLQHLFECIYIMENNEQLYFTYKGKSFVLERKE